MLSLFEKIIFIVAVIATLVVVWFAVKRLSGLISVGHGKPDWKLIPKRLVKVILKVGTFQPVFKYRFFTSIFHGLIGWGFGYYLLVNIVDIIRGFIPGFMIPGLIGDIYRILADLLSVCVLTGMIYFLVRRFVFKPKYLTSRDTTLLDHKARTGILRDSAIVGVFVILHVGFRFLGETFNLASTGTLDPWQPFASLIAPLWKNWSENAIMIGEHISFWMALGLVIVFVPYFPYTKHVHLFFAPLNYLLKPERKSIGELNRLDFEDETVEQFGASKLSDLGWEQIMDGYACIMCFRCQQVCPAYDTGKILSPAALEINKRYAMNHVNAESLQEIELRSLIPDEAVWACTSCGACVDICPVGNEPMRDILDIRRSLVLMENAFPKQIETAFRGMERSVNPWNVSPAERMNWAEGLNVPTIDQNPDPDILWWVGCAPATDARAQKTAQAFSRILAAAGVNYAVLGKNEQCTGDSARRAGNEYLFNELASANVEMLNEVAPKRIVTTCPHCLHTLKNEYPSFGGTYQVIHHTQLINELTAAGKLHMETEGDLIKVTYHDPCYLGRHNHIFSEPRQDIKESGMQLIEMPRHESKSFCCGAGGGQMWKEEQPGTEKVNHARFSEAKATGAEMLAVGCPFCLTMLSDASNADGGTIPVKDIAEIVAAKLEK
ncbi:MAG: heterodisulfide reductase-related iron-sulfur binding cluster [Anaerolineales bacterium]